MKSNLQLADKWVDAYLKRPEAKHLRSQESFLRGSGIHMLNDYARWLEAEMQFRVIPEHCQVCHQRPVAEYSGLLGYACKECNDHCSENCD